MRKSKAVVFAITLALVLPVLWVVLSVVGCQSGSTGLLRPLSPAAEHSITNTIVVASQTAASVVPAPYSTAIEIGSAAILALLSAWQLSTHTKLKTLTTEVANGKSKPPV
jgi:hypothetical protein